MAKRTSWDEIKAERPVSVEGRAAYEDEARISAFRSLVHRLRTEAGLTQAELARRAGVAVTSLSDILNDKRRISPKVRAKFAQCFGVSASFFA